MRNRLKTTFLLAGMTAFFLLMGRMLGGQTGMVIALILAAGINLISYWFSDRIVLKLYNANEVKPEQTPELYSLVRSLAQRANLPIPKIYLIPKEAPNAFATGRNPEHAVVAVTEGLLEILSPKELQGVISHELAHIKNRDILIGSIAATIAGAIMLLADMFRWAAFFGGGRSDDEGGGSGAIGLIFMAILAPFAALLIQMAISRSREYLADANGAKFAGNPDGLADALGKLDAYSRRRFLDTTPSTAHIFTVNPLSGSGLMSLFSTHPPPAERIARLRNIGFEGKLSMF